MPPPTTSTSVSIRIGSPITASPQREKRRRQRDRQHRRDRRAWRAGPESPHVTEPTDAYVEPPVVRVVERDALGGDLRRAVNETGDRAERSVLGHGAGCGSRERAVVNN